MSCKSGCDAPTNSAAAQCPNRMEDGRAFTDYRSRCAVNAELYNKVVQAKMMASSYESRIYLQQNCDSLMQENFQAAVGNLMPCAPCARPFSDPGTMEPERYVVRCDAVSCSRTETNPNGIGDGRNYAF